MKKINRCCVYALNQKHSNKGAVLVELSLQEEQAVIDFISQLHKGIIKCFPGEWPIFLIKKKIKKV